MKLKSNNNKEINQKLKLKQKKTDPKEMKTKPKNHNEINQT